MKVYSIFFVLAFVTVWGAVGHPLDKYSSGTLFAAATKKFGREVIHLPRQVISAVAPYAPDTAKVVGFVCFCICMQKLADMSKKK